MNKKVDKGWKIYGGLVVMIATIIATFTINGASALTYSSDTPLLFTFNPSVSLTVSGDLNVSNLTPGASLDSNAITVTASSTTMAGYTLYTNVGNSTYNYTDLRLSPSDTTNVFGVLPSAVSSLDNIGSGKWGYSYCNNTNNCSNSSNWVSGSVDSTSVGYGVMPLYNDANHNGDIILANTTSSASTTINFKIGAKASDTQVSGSYTNVINFINVPKVYTTDYTLQYLDASGTTTAGTLPASSTGTSTDGTFTITSDRPSNTNTSYAFKGWCAVDNSSDVTSCPGSVIYPGSLYVINSTNPTWTGSVYAIW